MFSSANQAWHAGITLMCVGGASLQLDQQLAGLVRKVKEVSRRRNFYLAFSQSPVDFINSLIASQVTKNLLPSIGNPPS